MCEELVFPWQLPKAITVCVSLSQKPGSYSSARGEILNTESGLNNDSRSQFWGSPSKGKSVRIFTFREIQDNCCHVLRWFPVSKGRLSWCVLFFSQISIMVFCSLCSPRLLFKIMERNHSMKLHMFQLSSNSIVP